MKEPRFNDRSINYLNRPFAFVDTSNVPVVEGYQKHDVPDVFRDAANLTVQ
jgi:hypothetical protein